MRFKYLIIALLFLCVDLRAQNVSTSFGKLRMFNGTAITFFGDFNNTDSLIVDSGVTCYNYSILNNSGTISKAGTFAYYYTATLIYSGLFQQLTGPEISSLNGPSTVVINNSNGVNLGLNSIINNLTFTSGNLNIDNKTLTINGNITTNSGAISGGLNANLNLYGSTATIYFDQTNSITRTINNFTLNNSSSSITLGNAAEVTGTLSLANGTLATGGNLKLVSNANGTARVGTISGNGAITGNVIVEKFIPAWARRWRFMSSAISNTNVEDWRGEIYITGAGVGNTVGTLNSNGFDATISNSPSVYSYDETFPNTINYGWTAAPKTSTGIVVGKGYRVFVRGDRSTLNRLNGIDNTQNAVTMNLIGAMNTGDILLPVTYTNNNLINDDGWNMLGNPYPSQYDWYAFWNTGNSGNSGTNYSNINPTIYVWDAISNTYKSFNALSNRGTLSNGVIASGQGFFIKATSTLPSITFKEQFKTAALPAQLLNTTQSDELQLTLELDSINYDAFILKFNDVATFIDDEYDIKKWVNPTVNISSYGRDTIMHTLDSRPSSIDNDTIYLNMNGSNGTYNLSVNSIPALGKFYFLQDLYLNNLLPLLQSTNLSFSIQSSDSASEGSNRFRIISSSTNYLPGVYGTFNATKISNQVQLNWNTLSEFKTSQFEIERSIDTSAFVKIGNVTAAGNSNTTSNYQFIDLLPSLTSTNFYRIKLIDSNSYFKYSDIQSVSFSTTGIANIHSENFTVYPNPATDIITLTFDQNVLSNFTISIYSLIGNLVKETYLKTSLNKIEININHLSKGMYFIKVVDESGNILSKKFLVE